MLSNFDDDDDDNGSLQTCKIGWEEFVVPNEWELNKFYMLF